MGIYEKYNKFSIYFHDHSLKEKINFLKTVLPHSLMYSKKYSRKKSFHFLGNSENFVFLPW